MPVNLFGLCADLPEIMKLAREHDVKVIEDSACGFDSWIGDKHSGTFGDVGCFSFHPRKVITTGEGGMLITDSDEMATMVKKLRDHGAGKSDLERHREKGGSLLPDFEVRGYNYRMTDIQGAIGICQMQKTKEIMSKRREIANKYYQALNTTTVNGIKLSEYLIPPYIPKNYIHGFQSYVCLFVRGEDIFQLVDELRQKDLRKLKDIVDKLNIQRNKFMSKLEEKEISTRQGTHAVYPLSYYREKYGLSDEDFIVSYIADRLSVALPLYPSMTEDEFSYVIEGIKSSL